MNIDLGKVSLIVGLLVQLIAVLFFPVLVSNPGRSNQTDIIIIVTASLSILGAGLGIYSIILPKGGRTAGIFGFLLNILFLAGFLSFVLLKA